MANVEVTVVGRREKTANLVWCAKINVIFFIKLLSAYVLFYRCIACDDAQGNSSLEISFYARAYVNYGKRKLKFP